MGADLFGPPPLPSNQDFAGHDIESSRFPAYGTPTRGNVQAFGQSDGPSFSDLLDILNPLQHIPVVNTIYEHLTDDKEGAVADLVGGTLWGGFIGLGAAMANLAVEDSTGKNVSDNMLALLGDDDTGTAVADATPSEPRPAADGAQAASPVLVPVAVTRTPASADEVQPVPSSAPNTAALQVASRPQDNAESASDGPVLAGGYMIFGGAEKGAPVSLVPAHAEPAAASPANVSPARVAPADNDAGNAATARPSRIGNFLVFGANDRPANSLPETAALADTTRDPAPAAAPATRQPNATGARVFPIPPRNGPAAPPTTLPLPTTGPAAVPGQARQIARRMPPVAGEPDGGQWFVGAFNQAMDKYQRAARLGGDAPAAASAAQSPIN